MYNNPWGGGYPPQTPVVFMPPPPASNQPIDYVSHITQSIQQLEALKKAFKEEKKPDDKKKSEGQASVIGMMLFMILMSPITGPIVFYFFQLSANLVHR